jgi:ATP-dependent helicase/nuclease subunit A
MMMGRVSRPVHSFCQSILRRFPIEAGVAPHVQLADDDEQSRLKAMARANILYHPSPGTCRIGVVDCRSRKRGTC